MSMMQRLLGSLHNAVFDTSPDNALAFFIRHADAVTWAISDQVLTAKVSGRTETYALDTITVGQLAGQLVIDGFDVSGLSAEFSGLSASVLTESAGSTRQQHGDRIYGFRDLLRSLFGGYARELREVKYQAGEAVRQMVITQAEDEWLDLWGALYNSPRPFEMSDAELQDLIPKEAFRIRVNGYAIEQAILDLTGLEVTIDEPWGNMFRLDESALSGSDAFYDGSNVGYHLIRPTAQKSIDWSLVMPIVERNRAAGVLVLDPETQIGSGVDASINGSVWFGATTAYAWHLQFFFDSRLNYLVLSDEIITKNWPMMMSQVITLGNTDGLLDPVSIAFRRNIAMASITLSDGVPLGDINAVLPRFEITQSGGEMAASDNLNLSTTKQKSVKVPVDNITERIDGKGEVSFGDSAIAEVGRVEINGAFVVGEIDGSTTSYQDELLSIAKEVPAPESVSMIASTMTGYTWSGAKGWGEFPWSASSEDIDKLEAATQKINNYVENIMFGDLT